MIAKIGCLSLIGLIVVVLAIGLFVSKTRSPGLTPAAKAIVAQESAAKNEKNEKYMATVMAFVECQKLVKARLKSPASAKFASMGDSEIMPTNDTDYTIKSYVDSQNGFGANVAVEVRVLREEQWRQDVDVGPLERSMSRMAPVFISYRREDSQDMAWRLLEFLTNQGHDTVVDMDTFGAGDFRESIRKAVESASVVMVVVGQRWLDHPSSSEPRSPGEWVRVELELAFATGTPVLPVLVHGSAMPKADCLPETIRDFAFQQAASVRSDAHFADDAKKVCTMLEQLAPRRRSTTWWRRFAHRLSREP